MEREDYLTTAQAAELLHMKPATLARRLSEGTSRLVGVKVGKQWLIRRDSVVALLEPPRAPQGQ
jgi:excisionase family DNA binding protein